MAEQARPALFSARGNDAGHRKAIKRDAALKLALNGKAHDPNDMIRLLDAEKIELDESGNLKGSVDDLLKTIRESKPYLFAEEKEPARPRSRKQSPQPPGAARPQRPIHKRKSGECPCLNTEPIGNRREISPGTNRKKRDS